MKDDKIFCWSANQFSEIELQPRGSISAPSTAPARLSAPARICEEGNRRAPMSSNVIYALDFDGVCVDSCDESSLSAYRASGDVWGSSGGAGGEAPEWLLRGMRIARPSISTGWENVVIARALLEAGVGGAEALATSFTKDDWTPRRDAWMQEWGITKDELVDAFGTARDRWINADREGWAHSTRFYPGVIDAINFSSSEIYIITTKQRRFVDLLLETNGVTKVPSDRIYAFGSGSKIGTLKKILKEPKSSGKTVCFVEDRYETLEETSLSMLGSPLKLYLATWGYNTETRRIEAERHPLIDTLDLNSFVTKLQ